MFLIENMFKVRWRNYNSLSYSIYLREKFMLYLKSITLLLTILALPAFANPPLTHSSPQTIGKSHSKVSHKYSEWEGLWTGPEGLFVFVTLTKPGEYELEMMGESEDMKDNIRIPGKDAEGGIAFERDGKTLTLHSATGEETGLKWLDGMKNCLMVEEFEGFCRD